VWWCLSSLLLTALQPFLFTHFRQYGWEDEPGFRIRTVEARALFSQDERDNHRHELETALFVPAGAHLDAPDALRHGLDTLLGLVFLLLPLTVGLALFAPPVGRIAPTRVPFTGGAPPCTPWRSHPPETAPPAST